MRIGVPKEIKPYEYRVGLTPEAVAEYVRNGHTICIEMGAGDGIGAQDDSYRAAGAQIARHAEDVFAASDMIIKVKEPQAEERKHLRSDHILFAYLHLAPDAQQTEDLLASGATCIAYETVTDAFGGLPLLKPMSQVAGRLAVQAGAVALENEHGGRGILLGGVPGVAPGRVVILGGGVVGENAAQMAVGMLAHVTILDRNPYTLEKLDRHFEGRAELVYSSPVVIDDLVAGADLVIGAVLLPGAAAPKLVSQAHVKAMRKGAVLVDVAIDQGGCFETSRPTTHADPTFIVDDVVHYCVANMPGAVARTSTYALNNATLPHGLAIANLGWRNAMRSDPHLKDGLNIWNGKITCRPVADHLGLAFASPDDALL